MSNLRHFENSEKNKENLQSQRFSNNSKKESKDARAKKWLYHSYDQTLSIARMLLKTSWIKKIISNRIQYLFVDEFQDTGIVVIL
jgi:DNA helicase-2/ATP-dependent DNA helicase PcrA